MLIFHNNYNSTDEHVVYYFLTCARECITGEMYPISCGVSWSTLSYMLKRLFEGLQ